MNWKVLVPFLLNSIFTIEQLGASNELKPNWDHKNLTYTITVYSNKLPRHVIDKIIAEAFNAWSAVADLTFTRLYSGDADIVIRFGSYDHSCPSGQSFDGPGGVLAHSDRNYIHFDESEKWQTGIDSDAINLHSVAVHEIGHILGLGASPLKKSIMNVSYNPRKVETRLQIDDIKRIQHMYGARATNGGGHYQTTTTSSVSTEKPIEGGSGVGNGTPSVSTEKLIEGGGAVGNGCLPGWPGCQWYRVFSGGSWIKCATTTGCQQGSWGSPLSPSIDPFDTFSDSFPTRSWGQPVPTLSRLFPTLSRYFPTFPQPFPTYSQPFPTYSQPANTFPQPANTFPQPANTFPQPLPHF